MNTPTPLNNKIDSIIELFSSGHISEALNTVQTLISQHPNEALLHNISGVCSKATGQLEMAAQSFKSAIEIKSDFADAHYNLGLTLQELNQLDDAVKCYEKALMIKPDYAEAFNNLGVTLKDLDQLDEAVKCYEKALIIKPNYAEAHNNLGNALKNLGKVGKAIECFERMLTIEPNYAEGHNNLGITLMDLGQPNAAVKSYMKALAIDPDYADAHNNLGITLNALGRIEDAEASYQKALAIKPDYAEVHSNLGVTLQEIGKLENAEASYMQAIALKPDYAEAHSNLGNTLKELGRFEDSEASYMQAIALKPDYAEAHSNLGNTLKELGRFEDSEASYMQAIALKPDYAEGHNNLGITLMDLGQPNAAVKSYMKALAIDPDYAGAHNNLGIVLNALGEFDGAVKSYKKALAIKPDFAEAHSNLGDLLTNLRRFNEALASYESAFNLKPDTNYILGKLLNTKMYLCLWDDLSSMLDELQDKINNNEKVIDPFPMLGLIDDPELQKKVTKTYVNKNLPKSHDLPRIALYPKHKKIRIGYFSCDFHEHPVSALTAELYEIHDRSHFEIYGFSHGPDIKDEMNLRIKTGVDHFYDVHTMPHKDVAMLARSLEIDIAVDLGGHTKNARTGIFAMSAAPIQVSYIGYIGTMGANYYDYLLADQTMIPEKNQKYYTEKIVYLQSFQVNDSTQSAPSTTLTRQDVGLPETGFVFCSFNNHFKITPTTFDSWGRILKKVKDSVLLIYTGNESAQINLTKEITLRGIDPSRLIFGKHLSKPEYLARYRVADLFLDTHPYNAGTTASDALRMELPVLTYLGSSAVSRHAASVITALNLPELITTTEEEYEKLAVELATDPEKLKKIKDKLVGNLPIAPLYNTPMFTRHLECAYSMMYDRYQRGLDPDHIYAESIKITSQK